MRLFENRILNNRRFLTFHHLSLKRTHWFRSFFLSGGEISRSRQLPVRTGISKTSKNIHSFHGLIGKDQLLRGWLPYLNSFLITGGFGSFYIFRIKDHWFWFFFLYIYIYLFIYLFIFYFILFYFFWGWGGYLN
jgi:hypothetical protein